MSVYTLNEINEMIYNIQQLIEDGADQEEIQLLLNAKEMAEMERSTKLESYAMVIKNLESNVNGIDSEIKRLTERKRFMQSNISNLKNNMAETLKTVDGQRLKTEKFTFAFRKSTKVVVDNIDMIPEDFVRKLYDVNKTDLKKYMERGAIVNGARLLENQSLSIR